MRKPGLPHKRLGSGSAASASVASFAFFRALPFCRGAKAGKSSCVRVMMLTKGAEALLATQKIAQYAL
jgi:hypothetical protein